MLKICSSRDIQGQENYKFTMQKKKLLDTFWCARFELLTFSGKIPKNKFFTCVDN